MTSPPTSFCSSRATPPLTPDLSPSPTTSVRSRCGSTFHLDFTSLQSIQEPAKPTDTLILTNLAPALFQEELLRPFRETIASVATIISWIPLKSFSRVVVTFNSAKEAIEVRKAFDGQPLLRQAIKIFYGEKSKLMGHEKRDSLTVPPLEKNWLISPPGSPPVGWTQIREDPPNVQILHEDLLVALAGLHPGAESKTSTMHTGSGDPEDETHVGEQHREVTLLTATESQGPGIVVHLDEQDYNKVSKGRSLGDIGRTKVSMVKTPRPDY